MRRSSVLLVVIGAVLIHDHNAALEYARQVARAAAGV